MNLNWGQKKRGFIAGCCCALVCEIIFGFSFACTKTVTNHYPAFYLLAWRFNTAFLVMTLLYLTGIVRVTIPKQKIKTVLSVGFLFPGCYYICEAIGVTMTTSAEVGLIVASVPAVTLGLSMLILKEQPMPRQIFGIFMSIGGVVACVASKGLEANFNFAGYLFVFLAIFCFCLFTILTKKIEGCSIAAKLYLFLAQACVIYNASALIQANHLNSVKEFLLLPFVNLDFLFPVLYLGIACSLIALYLCNLGISYIGATRFTSFIGFETIVAILAGVFLLGESFSSVQIAGSVFVIAGIYLANSTGKKNSTERKE